MSDKTKYKSLLLEGIHSKAEDLLSKSGIKVKTLSRSPDEKEFVKALEDIAILGSRSRTQITENTLKAKSLLCVGAFCIGTNQIDLDAACDQGVAIFNAPYSNTRSVAEMVMGFIISLSRNLFDVSSKAHQGVWQKSAKGSFEVRGKTLGIIGYGNIGSQIGILAESLGIKVIYYDIVTKLPLGNAKPTHDMETLLKKSDFVTLHVPETKENKNLIQKKQFSQMKDSAFFINTSRGSVVNIEDLKKSLDSEKIAGAAIDVYPEEPKNNKEQFHSVLQNTKRVILTPHMEEAQKRLKNP